MKYAFVTGSTKGIGKAIGLKLLKEGYFVVFNYNSSDEDAVQLKTDIGIEYKDQFTILKADLSKLDKVDDLIAKLTQISLRYDLIVFNAGLTDRAVFGEIKAENWLNVFNANLNVPFFILQSILPHLNKKSNVVFIGSMLGNIPHSVSVSYGVSKSAVHALVKNMVKFLSADEIRINAIAPGFVDTNWQKEKPEWLREKIKGKVALKRFAHENEVANLCYHITQNEYLTGQIIQLDGGYNYE